MKKVLAVLVVAGAVCASTMARAAIVNTSLGNVVTRSAASDTANGDAQSWNGNNNRKDIGSGGTAYADSWGGGTGWWVQNYGADAMLAAYDRGELNTQIAAAGPNWTASLVVDFAPSWQAPTGTPAPVVGVFKTDQVQPAPGLFKPDLDWTSSNVQGQKANGFGVNDITTGQLASKWISGGVAYNNFEAMVRGSGTPWSVDSYSLVPGWLNGETAMVIPIGQSLVNAYLADPNMTGFFLSNADPTGGTIFSHGGTQWSHGVGYVSVLITPEPATLCLLALGGLALLRRRHA